MLTSCSSTVPAPLYDQFCGPWLKLTLPLMMQVVAVFGNTVAELHEEELLPMVESGKIFLDLKRLLYSQLTLDAQGSRRDSSLMNLANCRITCF